MKIGVYGSAAGEIDYEVRKKAADIGKLIAQHDGMVVTGACPGLPHEAVTAANSMCGKTKGFSPYSNAKYHELNGFPDGFDEIVFTGAGKKGRNLLSVNECDAAIFIAGRIGTMNEFSIAYDDYDETKAIGVLTGTGGFADEAKTLVERLGKPTKAKIFYSNNPEELVEKIVNYLKSPDS